MPALEDEFICQEIREQPAIVRARAALPAPSMPGGGRTVLAGAGDSLCAAELCAAIYPGRGLEPLPALHASEVARELGPADALLGISVSGRTPRVVEAALRAGARGARVIAVTDDPASPLAEAAGETWLIGASPLDRFGRADRHLAVVRAPGRTDLHRDRWRRAASRYCEIWSVPRNVGSSAAERSTTTRSRLALLVAAKLGLSVFHDLRLRARRFALPTGVRYRH